ncbi:hypothetical protein [Solimonas marina]|uniref:Uncharacterized protein n=1 Tax=Solimonas marina TaxID=2714601 RepID=A0A969W994_9GAMM|nr:hypothetical protein [Solimonas marina]NKF22707.1 hypothetical protein [Solimonas marina]
MKPLTLPLQLPLWELAQFSSSREHMRQLLGAPHYTETDSTRTFGGEEEAWGLSLPSGQRVLITFQVPYGTAVICADPPSVKPVLAALGLSTSALGVTVLSQPVPLS